MEKINKLKQLLINLNKVNKNFHDLWIRSFEASPYSYKEIFENDKRIILDQKNKLLEMYSKKQDMYDILIFSRVKNIVNDFFDLKTQKPIDFYYLQSLMIILIPHLIESEYKIIDSINYRKKTVKVILPLTYRGFKKWDYVERISEDNILTNKIRIEENEEKFLILKNDLKNQIERFKILHNHYILVLWDKKDMRYVTRYNFFRYYIWVILALIVALTIFIVWYIVTKTNQ